MRPVREMMEENDELFELVMKLQDENELLINELVSADQALKVLESINNDYMLTFLPALGSDN
jgi:hypothetical protein